MYVSSLFEYNKQDSKKDIILGMMFHSFILEGFVTTISFIYLPIFKFIRFFGKQTTSNFAIFSLVHT